MGLRGSRRQFQTDQRPAFKSAPHIYGKRANARMFSSVDRCLLTTTYMLKVG
jgi:hypothetical protein